MMGCLPSEQNTLFYDFNLEQHIPDDHLLRKIDKFLDFDEIRQHLQSFYSHTGQPSIAPELMIRMLIVGYCYGIRSERRLCEEINYNLAYRWFCQIGLEDEVPNHSTFSKNRHGRYRESDLFRFVFDAVVQRCMDEGLVKGECFAIDASLVKADVSRQRAIPGSEVIDWGPSEEQSRPVREYLSALDTEQNTKTKPKSISLTDPVARWTAAKGPAIFAYSTNIMIDVAHGVIMDVEATPGFKTDEVERTKVLLERIETKRNLKPKRLMGDTAYGCADMLGYLVNEKNIEPHVPIWDKSKRNDGTYSVSDFTWKEKEEHYECPKGKLLQRSQRKFKIPRSGITKANTILYRSKKLECDICEDKSRCCPNTPNRKIARSIHEAARDVAREINQSDIYIKQTFHERKKVEMQFAHMKRNLKFDRLRLRGLSGANDEFLLVATAQNLRKMARLCGRSPPTCKIASP
ncbi:Mobile element protein [hydrothermal vent metagenome]|uniref:Mobile element protein n=1 Tax=hydrothermal vent metagenome TaxID=652676 RepID=A0A3B0XNK5_9ZZZZ